LEGQKTSKLDFEGIWIFIEIKDHEKILDGSLELLTKGRELADKLDEKLYAIVLGLEVQKYLPEIEEYGPDFIIHNKETEDPQTLKHYNGEIFPEILSDLIKKHKPSIFLFPATEAGGDLASRLAYRFSTGCTAHCSNLDIINSEKYGNNLLLMIRPGFSGNLTTFILCPYTRPQMATIQQGVFKKRKSKPKKSTKFIQINCEYDRSKLKILNVNSPQRWRESTSIEKADIIIAGGRGLGSKENFKKLFQIADILNAEVGSTRAPVIDGWCEKNRMIGQTGKVVNPRLYIGFGISGQIQHTSSIISAKRIYSVNMDPDALINNISDYIITEDINLFLPRFLERLKEEKKYFLD
jgi:electron transfer flavoprotein alpha subunit